MHPDLAAAHVTAWENRERRIEYRSASIQLTSAQLAGAKKKSGGPITINDFLPLWLHPKKKKKTIEEETAYLKEAFSSFIVKSKT